MTSHYSWEKASSCWTEEEENQEIDISINKEEDLTAYFGNEWYAFADRGKHVPICFKLFCLMIVLIVEQKSLEKALNEAFCQYKLDKSLSKGATPSHIWVLPRVCEGGLRFWIATDLDADGFVCSAEADGTLPVLTRLDTDLEDWINSNLRFDYPGSNIYSLSLPLEKIQTLLPSISLTDDEIEELHQRLCNLGE